MGPGQDICFPVSEMLIHRHWSILLAPTKRGVLQDMGHTSVIRRVCFIPDGEDIILVIPCNMEILCSSLVMFQMKSCKLQLRDMLRTFQRKAMNIPAWPGILIEVCHRGKTSTVQGLMDTLANLPSRITTVRLQDPPQRHSQHIKVVAFSSWRTSRDKLRYGSSAIVS